jgi:hypothetical protein
MADVIVIARKLREYINNLDVNLPLAIEPVKDEIVALNKKQFNESKGGDGKPLIHLLTGSELLSPQYAKRTNKKKPNIYLTGDYQRQMDLDVVDDKTYFIFSWDFKQPILTKHYENLNGVAPENRAAAYAITTPAIIKHINETIL